MAALNNTQKRLTNYEALADVGKKTRAAPGGLDRATVFFWPTGGGETTIVVMPVDMMGGVSG